MKPIEFPEQNCVYAKDQPEYLPLPAHKTPDGMVISCWALTWRERVKMLLTGRMWWSVLTFNHPLQPQLPSVDTPFTDTANWRRSLRKERCETSRSATNHLTQHLPLLAEPGGEA